MDDKKQNLLQVQTEILTKYLCYRKDDRAMHPINGYPENYRDSLTTPMLLFLKFFVGFCSDRPYKCSYKI